MRWASEDRQCKTLKIGQINHSLKEPDIAVLLPVFNADDDLILTLDSLRKQSAPFRLFLVDDGSSKKTDYEKHCQNIDCSIIRLPKNRGISGAMNEGLKLILAGEFKYIARIDAGDVCAPTRFAQQLAFLESHQTTDILGTAVQFQQQDNEGHIVAERIVDYPLTDEACVVRLHSNMPVSHPAIMIRRKVFETLREYSENYPAAEDYDLMWRATNAGFKLANLAEPLLIKIENPNSISQKYRRKQVFSRLRIQWRNHSLFNLRSYFGMLRSVVVLVAPRPLVSLVKSILG
jgi:glycosyltransferase involved in cell wall biosynthesis